MLFSQEGRVVIGLNSAWQFSKEIAGTGQKPVNGLSYTKVNLPHSWNTTDVTDDEPGYYRGAAVYTRKLDINSSFKGRSIFIYFEGANQYTEVYVNGKLAGSHTGGYTRFCFQIDSLINFDKGAGNILQVKVDNRFNEDIPPLTADFTFFGGIYRDVYLIAADRIHFNLGDASTGVYINSPEVSEKQASLSLRIQLSNDHSPAGKVVIQTTVKNREGKVVTSTRSVVRPGAGLHEYIQKMTVSSPRLWSPDDPYLYFAVTKIINQQTGRVLDEVTNPVGLRWFKFDPESGFYLNGKPLKLIGASRHQDYKGMANALPDSYHAADIRLLKDMGANFLRVAHYPQDPVVLETCDKLGILASVEIPVVNTITETEQFYQNCKNMQVEMIRQNFNHPSLILWAYMNEILLRTKFAGDKPRQEKYFANITKLATELEALTRKEDPSRYTMISNHGDFNRYKQLHLTDIPMVIGWNLYQGWYSGKTENFADFLDRHHKELPGKPLLVTEYGADADPRIHALNPVRFDKSIEYSLDFHAVYLKAIRERNFVAGAMIWNLADFNSETREETMPHINNKGMLTLDRKPKDLYTYYQGQLLKTPFVKISNWRDRSGVVNDSLRSACVQPLEVFSNADNVRLSINGKIFQKQAGADGRFIFQLPFAEGLNRIDALISDGTGEYRDHAEINFQLLPAVAGTSLKFPEQLNILLGADRFFIEEAAGLLWIPAGEYKPGSWGYTGGRSFKMSGNVRQSYGTDRNIKDTENDPVYQTQITGITGFKFDAPDGEYELVLHFAELLSDEKKEALAYNLDNSASKEKAEERVFNVLINGKCVLENFNISEKYNALTAAAEKFKVLAEGGRGIEIRFEPLKGEAVLNAVQLLRR